LSSLLVMKFGGTSMGSADRIRIAAEICAEARSSRPVIAVVSAMSKVTDLLLDTLKRAEHGEQEAVVQNVTTLRERHVEACRQLLPEPVFQTVVPELNKLIFHFDRIARGVLILGERPPRSVDEAIAIGERLSSQMLAAYLNSQGVRAEAVNAADVIVTDASFGSASPLMDKTRTKSAVTLGSLLAQGILPVVTGFNGATEDGRPTTLGRGGSDYSASILASALDAQELWIWTDVDGIMSADPRLVPNAVVLPEVTYNEAAELAYAGAKVLHPRTLAPLIEKQIPVWSKNSFNRSAPGTKIVPQTDSRPGPRAVTSMDKVALLSIEPASFALSGTQVMGRVIDALARVDAEVLALSSSSYRQSFCVLVRLDELDRAMESLNDELALEIQHGYLRPIGIDTSVGLLAMVGEGMRGTHGVAGRIFTAISKNGVNIIAIAQGSSEITIAIVVAKAGLETAVRAVHEECELGTL
jgi:bifunctional aspartokinase / homoserine dehydrogenase 1